VVGNAANGSPVISPALQDDWKAGRKTGCGRHWVFFNGGLDAIPPKSKLRSCYPRAGARPLCAMRQKRTWPRHRQGQAYSRKTAEFYTTPGPFPTLR